MNVTDQILLLRKKYKIIPQKINQGNCDSFAQDLLDIFPDGDTMWGENALQRFKTKIARNATKQYYHCFFFLNGLYYDAECPQGVKYPDDLPFYQRAVKSTF
jgi:hypothetical protein